MPNHIIRRTNAITGKVVDAIKKASLDQLSTRSTENLGEDKSQTPGQRADRLGGVPDESVQPWQAPSSQARGHGGIQIQML